MYVITNGLLTGIKDRDETFHPIVRSFARAIGIEVVLMDDTAMPHYRANIVNQYHDADYRENGTAFEVNRP